ncbi:MAG: DF family (seleno)protein [Halobacteriota archaeon]
MIKKIDILYHEKCSHYPRAIERVKQVLSEEGIDAEINEIQITSEEEARKYKFFGSPTIRIDDEDLESEEERQKGHDHVLDSCRIYNYKGQLYMIPHKEAIRLALRKRK